MSSSVGRSCSMAMRSCRLLKQARQVSLASFTSSVLICTATACQLCTCKMEELGLQEAWHYEVVIAE